VPALVSNEVVWKGLTHISWGLPWPVCVVLSMVTPAFAQASSAAHTQVMQLVDERAANWKHVVEADLGLSRAWLPREKSSALLQAQLKAAGSQ